MRTFGWLLGRVLLVLAVLVVGLLFWPMPGVGPVPRFDTARLPAEPAELDRWLAEREAVIGDITEGAEKRILWAGEPGARTDLALVYLHGFSATSQEIAPVPERVAAELGANLYLARLAGHGRDGAALAGVSPEDWLYDLAEALAIAARLGERTVLVGTSTGAALAMAGLGDPALAADLPGRGQVAGLVLISPNYRLHGPAARLLDLPLVEHWGEWIAGDTVHIPAVSEDHARFWTLDYPSRAVLSMVRLARHLRGLDPAGMVLPALFLHTETDRVIEPGLVRRGAEGWGGPAERVVLVPGEGDDAWHHIPGGDILSPGLTETLSGHMLRWLRGL